MSIYAGCHALIADPDLRFSSSLKEHLASLGFTVAAVSTAREAEEAAEAIPPDLLICEIMLEYPDSGFVLLHHLRSRYPSMCAVVISGVSFRTGLHFDLSDPGAREWINADAVLDKDIRFEQLDDVLSVALFERSKVSPQAGLGKCRR